VIRFLRRLWDRLMRRFRKPTLIGNPSVNVAVAGKGIMHHGRVIE
jgi:hypothetical protein